MDELGKYGLLSDLQSSGTRPPGYVCRAVGAMNRVPVVQKAGLTNTPPRLGGPSTKGNASVDLAELQQETRPRGGVPKGTPRSRMGRGLKQDPASGGQDWGPSPLGRGHE